MSTHILNSKDLISQYFIAMNFVYWTDVLDYIQQLPYGRNSDRSNLDLVFYEKKGTCSSKHAFLKKIADLNKIPDVKLVLSMYKMSKRNTPQIGETLTENNLDYLPEAHCYLKINGQAKDLTTRHSNTNNIKNDILFEEEILPEQVIDFKVKRHQEFIKTWIKEKHIKHSFQEIWSIREQCIKNIESKY